MLTAPDWNRRLAATPFCAAACEIPIFQVKLRFPDLGKHFFVFFLDVVADVFPENDDFGVVVIVSGLHAFKLLDKLLGRGVLDVRFVQQRIVFDRAACGRIEDFFLDPRMDFQFTADFA